MGIIDLLQQFTVAKKGENAWKTTVKTVKGILKGTASSDVANTISAIEPQPYKARYMDLMQGIFKTGVLPAVKGSAAAAAAATGTPSRGESDDRFGATGTAS